MSQSFVKNYLHLIFSTKKRLPLLDAEIENEIFSYIGGIVKNSDCYPIIVGGHKDHIHVLCLLSKKVSLMKLIEKVKASSSKWIKTKGKKYKSFYWQNGYSAFSVNPREIEKVKDYIENQKDHHKRVSFEDEYLAFLKRYNIPYDPRYIWD